MVTSSTPYPTTLTAPIASLPASGPRYVGAGVTTEQEDRFVVVEDVPVFAEHETMTKEKRDATGRIIAPARRLKFGRNELALVAANCNRRIELTGDYATIIVGHTANPALVEMGRVPEKPVIGFAGPFKIGLIGPPGKQKYAILARLRVYREHADDLQKYPRRSAELWVEERYEDMFLDPIALISQTPRLDMGLLYSATLHAGDRARLVEKYSAVAPAMGDVFVPEHAGGKTKAKYSAGAPTMALGQDDIKQIVEAIMQTDAMRWATEKMMQENTPGMIDGQPDGASAPPDEGGDVPPVEDAGAPADIGDGGGDGQMPPDAASPPPPDASAGPSAPSDGDGMPPDGDDDEDDQAPPVAPAKKLGDAAPPRSEKKNYSRDDDPVFQQLSERLAKLEADYATTQASLSEERTKRIDAERYSRLNGLRAEGYVIDPAREIERLCYSKATDEQFDASLEFLTSHGTRVPVDVVLPTFDGPGTKDPNRPGAARESEKYSRENAETATRITLARRNAGDSAFTYEQALELARNGATA